MSTHLNESFEGTIKRLYSNLQDADVLFLLQLLVLPFEKWPQFESGLIDKQGNIIKKPVTLQEKQLLPPLMILLLKLKKDLLPSKEASYWRSYQTAFSRIFLTNNMMRENKDKEEATEQPLLIRRSVPEIHVVNMSEAKFQKLLDVYKQGHDIKPYIESKLLEMKQQNVKYFYITDGKNYLKIKV